MKRITNTQKVITLALVAFIASCGLYYMVLQQIQRAQGELAVAIEARDEAYHLSQNLERMQALVEGTRSDRAQLEAYRLPIKDPTAFLQLSEDVARELGVELQVESFELESYGENEQQRVRAVYEVVGDWSAMFSLLELYEHMPYASVIDHVAIKEVRDVEVGTVSWKGQVRMWVVARE